MKMRMLAVFSFSVALCFGQRFDGKHYRGAGDVEYLRLLDIAARMMTADAEYQNLSMLYTPKWNGLVEGPTWGAWWIQNSYGTSYAALPLFEEPFVRFLQNSQDLWFDQMGDGKREGCPSEKKHNWVAPDGALCDAAWPGCIIYRQGDGKKDIHDWGMEFTAAGIVLQAEAVLISRDEKAVARYLPLLERAANFIETRRDPANNLFLAGPAGNLLAPSYAGLRKPDGTYGMSYLTGLSITYIAALDRLIEVERLAGKAAQAKLYGARRDQAKQGLARLTTPEGYFIKYMDPDGTRHGVYGAEKHGYFETSPNHDAIAFRVVDDRQAAKILDKMISIPELRPHGLIIPNHPSLDDMYNELTGIWRFGHWVNGGHWSTCEGRMILAYYRMGRYDDARESMKRILGFADRFRMDNPLVDFGGDVYQPKQPVNITYDAFAIPAALRRGLFEYLYTADGLTLIPHIPGGITELQQMDPVRFGAKRLYLAVSGAGAIREVTVNGKRWKRFTAERIELPYAETPRDAVVTIVRGNAKAGKVAFDIRPAEDYAVAHRRLLAEAEQAQQARARLKSEGKLRSLPPETDKAADQLYADTVARLAEGLKR